MAKRSLTPSLSSDNAAPTAFPFMTPKAASALIGVSDKTMANWRSAGTGPPFYKPSPHVVLYRTADLITWAERGGPRFTSSR